jgi:hypothetical protein
MIEIERRKTRLEREIEMINGRIKTSESETKRERKRGALVFGRLLLGIRI